MIVYCEYIGNGLSVPLNSRFGYLKYLKYHSIESTGSGYCQRRAMAIK